MAIVAIIAAFVLFAVAWDYIAGDEVRSEWR
jgi:hypothetical protein